MQLVNVSAAFNVEFSLFSALVSVTAAGLHNIYAARAFPCHIPISQSRSQNIRSDSALLKSNMVSRVGRSR